ncbi:MAG: hypothetical protein EOM69_13420 [Clostridia bacterium]|nr:hypothetical protein [Clostridia bacterium]
MLESALYQALDENGKEGALYLLLDDLRLLPKLPRLENALRLGRLKGVRVVACASGVAPLRKAYGETGAQGLLTAFDTTVAFRLHDRETRDVVKNLYGRHRVVESYSSSLPQHTLIEQAMDQYVIEDEDLTALQTGESLVCALHYPPFWFRVKRYGQ